MGEKEVRIVYIPCKFRRDYYEIRCEGFKSGQGYTIEDAIKDFDYKNNQ